MKKPAALPLTILTAALALVYWRFLAGWAPAGRDIVLQYLPYQELVRRAIHAGEMPYWNSDTFCGRPLMADIQVGVLYPPNWLHWILPLPLSFTILFVAHTAFALWGAYRLGRRLNIDEPSSALFAILYAFGGFLTTKLQSGIILFHYVAAWFPWIALAVLALAAAPSARRMAVVALAIALSLLAGSPQMTFFAWIMTALLGAALLIPRRGEQGSARHRFTYAAFGVAAFALAMMLTAPQTFLTKQMTDVSFNRGANEDPQHKWDYITGGSLHPRLWLMMLNPGAFGPGHDEMLYSGTDTGFSEACAYLPVAVWMMLLPMGVGVFGLRFTQRRRGEENTFESESDELAYPISHTGLFFGCAALAAFGLAMAAGKYSPVYALFFDHVPGFDMFRVPARWMFVTTTASALAGALALNRWNALEAPARFKAALWSTPLVLGGAAAIAFLSVNFKSAYEWFGFYSSDAFAANPIFAGALRSTKGPQFPDAYSAHVAAAGLSAAGFLVAAWIALMVASKSGKPQLAWAMPILFAVELSMLAWPNQTVVRASKFYATFYPETPLVREIKKISIEGRVLWLDDLLDWRRDQNTPEVLTNALIMQGLKDARGYDPVNARAIGTWFNRLAGLDPNTEPGGYMRVPQIALPGWLKLMGVTTVLSYQDLSHLPQLQRMAVIPFPEGELGVWKNRECEGISLFLLGGTTKRPESLDLTPEDRNLKELENQSKERKRKQFETRNRVLQVWDDISSTIWSMLPPSLTPPPRPRDWELVPAGYLWAKFQASLEIQSLDPTTIDRIPPTPENPLAFNLPSTLRKNTHFWLPQVGYGNWRFRLEGNGFLQWYDCDSPDAPFINLALPESDVNRVEFVYVPPAGFGRATAAALLAAIVLLVSLRRKKSAPLIDHE